MTVVDLLRARSGRAFLFADEDPDTWVSYADIDAAARRIGAALSQHDVAGQPVLLLYPPGRAYVEGFLGCLYAGAIAVPAYPPDPARINRTLPRLRALIADSGARVALSLSWLADLSGLDCIATDTLPDVTWTPPDSDPGAVALLQYTSGSTGMPKGVPLTNAQLLHNSGLIRDGFGATAADVGVSWLPPYHDMGLIGGVLQPIFTGFPVALLSPLTFLARPMTWLETVSRLGATITGGPNFAFDLCVRKGTPEGLDLSRWDVAFCGAEPIRPDTLDRFAEAYAPAGFRREAFYPCYGLAEGTLIVTGGRRLGGPRLVGEHVSSGRVLGDQRLAIVDDEIWISGDSVMSRYWHRADETRELPDGHRYLPTGDLGFLDENGELVVTGRAKDLIIVRGRNIYPQDLERAVETIDGVRPGCVAAFEFGDQQIGLACEVRGEVDPATIRQLLAETCDVDVAAVILLAPGEIPKTSSGKIQRHACRKLVDTPAVVARVLDVGSVPTDEPLTRSGLDSLRAVEIVHALREELGITVSVSELLSGVTLAELAGRTPRAPAPVLEVDGSEMPATKGQRALWFVQRWAPDSTVYQISRAARVRSHIDADALEKALQELVRRHPALRTSLPARDGEPIQQVNPWHGPVLEKHDASDTDDLRHLVEADADRLFDLENGPLFRVSLFTRSATDHVLLLSFHHTITDFWSMSVFVDELLALYSGAALPPPGRPAMVEEDRLTYWKNVLDGAPPALELPTTYARPRVHSFRGASHDFSIADNEKLVGFARDNDVTLFATLLAAYAATLSRYAGDDIVTGIPVSGRDVPGSRNALGYLASPVPVRVRVDAGVTFRQLVAQVREAVLGAIDNAMPFAELVESLRPHRDASRTALMQTMFVLQAPPAGRPDLAAFAIADESAQVQFGGLDVSPFRLADKTSAFDLSVVLAVVNGRLAGSVEYSTELFDEPAISRLAAHFATLLAKAVESPDLPVASLDLADEAIEQFSTMPLVAETLPELLEKQPDDRTALVCRDERMSYGETKDRAARLAFQLHQRGVRRGSVVGVRLPRGIDAVVAFWGVLLAGGVYLPLEPDLPPARLEWMLADARPVTVVTELTDLGDSRFAADVQPDDLAYVIYTSGSTGRPKGVMVSHRSAANLGPALASVVGLGSADRLLLYASCAFDAWIAEVVTALSVGATLVVTPAEAAVPGPDLTDYLAGQRVSAAIFAPSTLAALPPVDLPDLRIMMCAGEALPADLVARWGRGREFFNLYGPTEATVCATGGAVVADGRRPSIGRPIPNVRTYVLDETGRRLPVGIPGELCIGGAGVARGYLNQPELTAGQFVPDPYGDGLIYRTGDRARWLPDGSVDFLGRIDDQVKIRGIRVEPGEVAARLRELLGVPEIAVVHRDEQLVAYLVAPDQKWPISELRGLLRAEFSGPWLPSAFVYLEAMPRTTSGKLDHRTLPAPTAADRGLAGQIAPRTPLETNLAQVWADLLGYPSVGVRDHFFEELGGTSLLVAKLASELRSRLDIEMPVTHIFEHPTVETLARRLQESGDSPAETVAGQDTAQARRRALSRRRGKGS